MRQEMRLKTTIDGTRVSKLEIRVLKESKGWQRKREKKSLDKR